MSLQSKIDAWAKSPQGQAKMQDKIKEYAKKGKMRTNAGDLIYNEEKIYKAAAKLISVLQKTARSYDLPASVMEHFDDLHASETYVMPDGSTQVDIYFGGDTHRDSLMPQRYGGVSNVVAVLNNGYGSHPNMEKVWGEWHGRRIHALAQREGMQFIQQAVRDFNGNYSADFEVEAVAGEEYE